MQFLLALSIAPVAALIALFYILDKYEPEPKNTVLKVFGFGILTVIPAAIIELICMSLYPDYNKPDNLLTLFLNVFFFVALVEEGGKFLVVYMGIYKSPEFDEPYDGIIYTVAASLGFAALENICYVLISGLAVGILRALLSVPGHALYGVVMGYFVGRSKFSKGGSRFFLLFSGLFLATIAHTLFDFLIFSKIPVLIICLFPFMVLLWILSLLLAKHAQSLSLYRYNPQKELSIGDEKCEQCGYSVAPRSIFCMNCGSKVRIPAKDVSTPAEETGAEDSKVADTRPVCDECGYINPERAKFCVRCGISLGG